MGKDKIIRLVISSGTLISIGAVAGGFIIHYIDNKQTSDRIQESKNLAQMYKDQVSNLYKENDELKEKLESAKERTKRDNKGRFIKKEA